MPLAERLRFWARFGLAYRGKTLLHRLPALAITGTDQPRNVKRAHPPPRLVPQACQERRAPDQSIPTRCPPWSEVTLVKHNDMIEYLAPD